METTIARVTGQPARVPRARGERRSAATRWVVTSLLVVGPVVALAALVPLLWGRFVTATDLALATFFYVVTGHGITVGFHRMFTHHSFRPCRALKIALGVAGSMAIQGSITGWVANHRCHHVHSDQPEDPHSPHRFGSSPTGRVKGFLHAHVGWLYGADAAPATRFAPDLLRDRDVVVLSSAVPRLRGRVPGHPAVGGMGALRHRAWRAHRVLVGRARTYGPPAPRDVEHQLRVPPHRPPTISNR